MIRAATALNRTATVRERGRREPLSTIPALLGSRLALIAVAFLASVPASIAQSAPARSTSSPASGPASQPTARLGAFQNQLEGFEQPVAAAITADGRIYVVQRGADRIEIMRSDGTRVGGFGKPGSAPGELLAPEGVAIGPGGEVFVADTGNHRVQVFSTDGQPLRAFGSYGAAPGQFNQPRAVAVSAARICIADTLNDRVQVFDLDGAHRQTLGGYGSEPGRMSRPLAVAMDDLGNLFVADGDNSRVQQFAPDGSFVRAWGDWGSFAGLLAEPRGLCLHENRLYVADTRNHRVQAFGIDGAPQYSWGLHALRPREGRGKLHYPDHVAVAPDGSFAVVCEWFENRVQVFGRGKIEESLGPPPSLEMGGAAHYGPRIDIDGPLLAATEPDSQAVLIYTLKRDEPILIGSFGGYGRRAGQFIRPADVQLDLGARSLLVLNAGVRRLDEFKLDWNPEAEIGFNPTLARYARGLDLTIVAQKLAVNGETPPIEPVAVDRDASGSIYVLDQATCRVLKLGPAFEPLGAWGGSGDDDGRFRRPTDLAVGPDGLVYVADELGRCAAYDADGRFVRAFATDGAAGPFGVCVARDGSVYWTDTRADCVRRFGADGRPLGPIGRRGLCAGEFLRPTGVAEDDRGRLIVLDFGNHRGQIFSAAPGELRFERAFGARLFVLPTRGGRP